LALWEKQFATAVNEATLTRIRTQPAYAEKLARSKPSENSAKLERAAAKAFLDLSAVTTILGNTEESATPTMSAMVAWQPRRAPMALSNAPDLAAGIGENAAAGPHMKVLTETDNSFWLTLVNHVTSLYLMIKQRVNSLHKYFFLMLTGVGVLSIIVPVLYLILRPELLIKALFSLLGLIPQYLDYAAERIWAEMQTQIGALFRHGPPLETISAPTNDASSSVVASSQFVHWLDGFSSAVGATGAIAVYWLLQHCNAAA
jgi:hypothetical protein